MLNPNAGVHRVIRALSLGLTCWSVTVIGHAFVGGAHSTLGLLMVGLLMCLLGAVATGSELRIRTLFAIVASTQVLAHVLLTFLSHSGVSSQAASNLAQSHRHSVESSFVVESAPTGGVGSATAMIAAHAVACIAAAAFLRYGESLYYRLHRVLPEVLQVLLGRALPSLHVDTPRFPAVRLTNGEWIRPLRDLLSVREIPQRGPPLLPFTV